MYDQSVFAKTSQLGGPDGTTRACILGIAHLIKKGYFNYLFPNDDRGDVMNTASVWLGLTSDQRFYLFCPRPGDASQDSEPTATDAVEAIRNLIARPDEDPWEPFRERLRHAALKRAA